MFNRIKNFFIDLVTDAGGGTNSKIFVGLISFVVSSVALFIASVPHDKLLIYIIFCASCFGMSCYDNKTSFQVIKEENKTETKTSNSTTSTDVTAIVNNTVDKFAKRGKKKL